MMWPEPVRECECMRRAKGVARALEHALQAAGRRTGGKLEGGALALEVPQLQRIAFLGGGEDEAVWMEHAG